MGERDTQTLLERARAGSGEALEDLYARAARKLLPLIRLRLGPALRARMESRDILQAALLKSWKAFPGLDAEEAAGFQAWLSRIAENEIRDRAEHEGRARRDVGREEPLEAAAGRDASPVRSAVSRAIVTEELERLERALEELDPPHREVIVLRKLQELSFREIGERMGRSEDAARMLLARAMTALTLKLGPG